MKTKTVAAVAFALACSTASAANLLTNGSFEAPNIVGGSYALYATNSTAITGWTVLGPTLGDSVQLTPDTYLGLRASDGRQWIDLTGIVGYDKGVQSDAFATVMGATYRISFDVGNYLPFGQATVGLSVAGGAEQLFTNTSLAITSTNPMNWTSFSVDWVANTTSTRLSLLGRVNGALSNNLGIGLDNVSVERVIPTVPEPETWSLMMVGLAAFAFTARRRTV